MTKALPITEQALPALTRRSVLTGGALLVGFSIAQSARAWTMEPDLRKTGSLDAAGTGFPGFVPSGFIRIGQDGRIILVMPSTEMGQGIFTAEAALIAEELEVGLDQIEAVASPVDAEAYKQSILGRQVTGGSTSIRAFWTPLREAGATARIMLVSAAAQRWQVPVDSCVVERGVVHHRASGRSLPYAALVDAARKQQPPAKIALKSPGEFRLIGQSSKRLDTPDKVTGQTCYGIDVNVPGMRTAALVMCPYIGGTIKSLRQDAARQSPGVVDVLTIDNAIAVVADHYWNARKGAELLDVEWEAGPNAKLSSADLHAALVASTTEPVSGRLDGDPDKVIENAATRVEASYDLPYLAHAALEPINTTVHVRKDGCDIWVGTQTPQAAQGVAAAITGLPPETIQIRNHMIGGGFGRRLAIDTIRQAVSFAKQVDYPLKIIWNREQDIQQDRFRPIYHDRIAAGLDAEGRPVGWSHSTTCSSVLNFALPAPLPAGAPDKDAFAGAIDLPYSIPAVSVKWIREENPVALNWWRGVGDAHNVFVVESFMDELALRAKADPIPYRLALLKQDQRSQHVLRTVAKMSNWGAALPARVGRGVSLHTAFGSYAALVVEVEVDNLGEIKVRRIDTAIDCGTPINPNSIIAQMQGGILFGLSAALFNEITFADGQVQQSNFHDYRQLRMNEAPPINVHIVESQESPGGIGEVGTVSIAPALTNAIAAATGIRLRKLPIDMTALALKDAADATPSALNTAIIGAGVAIGAATLIDKVDAA